jgi:hypothetical protein
MKQLILLCTLFLSCIGILKAEDAPLGAWKSVAGEVTSVLLVTQHWFTITEYNQKNFISSYGGTWKDAGNGEVEVTIHFSTQNASQVGQNISTPVSIQNGQLVTGNAADGVQQWTRIDEATSPLAGSWQITSRENNGKMNPIPNGARRTLKILTNTRFQWVAINQETGEFFGSGGGTYTFQNGTYTEKIEFFSRDNSRVGASLSFKGKVSGNNWDHSGKSSKGDPIHEVWTRE